MCRAHPLQAKADVPVVYRYASKSNTRIDGHGGALNMKRMGSRWLVLVYGALIISAMAGCKRHEAYVPPEIRRKADPGEMYVVRVTLESPKFRSPSVATGTAKYFVDNFQECMATDHGAALGGITPQAYRETPIQVRIESETSFVTKAYINPLMDEDYYGLGTCRWTLRAVTVEVDGLLGKIAVSVGDAQLRPGAFDLLCNDKFMTCGVDRSSSNPPPHFEFTRGKALISRD